MQRRAPGLDSALLLEIKAYSYSVKAKAGLRELGRTSRDFRSIISDLMRHVGKKNTLRPDDVITYHLNRVYL